MSARIVKAAKRFLGDMAQFARHVIGLPLREYQLDPIKAVRESILHGRGDEFVWVFARQSGKNEAVSQLQANLLNLFQRKGGGIVHTAPTGGQVSIGLARLKRNMDNRWNTGKWKRLGEGRDGVRLGKAEAIFLSGHPSANVRGETASILLIYDEYQDFVERVADDVFMPMCASTNATRLYIGTTKTSNTALATKTRELKRLEAQDGRQRVFVRDWEQVAAEVPAYGVFVRSEIRKKGERHPSIITEFLCQELDATGGLFDARRQALMRGEHERQSAPAGGIYIGLLDVAGEDEGEPGNLINPGRDYTICWIVEVLLRDDLPVFLFRDAFADQGSRHFDTAAGAASLNRRLAAWLQMWGVVHVVADASGVGLGLVSDLRARLGEHVVTPFIFSSTNKAALGTRLLAVVETGRFRMYAGEDEHTTETPAGAGFWRQVNDCIYEVAPDKPLEKGLRWFVPDGARYETVDKMGNPTKRPVHDDYLLAAGLVAEVDRLIEQGQIVMGRAESVVIEAQDL